MKKDIFDLLKLLETRKEEVSSVFCDSCFLDEEISAVWNILDEMYEITGMDTDKSSDIYVKFGCGEISKKKAQSLLRKIK